MSDENERDVEALRDALWCAMDLNWTPKTLARAVLASDWYVERIAEARREGAAEALDEYADHVMAEVARWDERVYPNRWINARDKAASVREHAAAVRGDA